MSKKKVDYKKKCREIIEAVLSMITKLKGFSRKEVDEDNELLKNLKNAQIDLATKEKYFNAVIEPDLIDYAIYDMEATKKKYNYFLKKVKEKGLSVK